MANSIATAHSDAEEALASICSPAYFSQHVGDQTYTNVQIVQVSRLLESTHNGVWTAIPRLYIVLHWTGLLRLRDLFLSARHTDAHFPYSTMNLPKGMKIDEKSAFLQAQKRVLTDAMHIRNWDFGEHVRFADAAHVPLERKSILGGGGSGQVEAVVLRSPAGEVQTASAQLFVRKLIHRRTFGRLQQGLDVFKNELKILKRLQHRHLVEIIGSYTDPSYAALIMTPVADCDLSDFLKKRAPADSHCRSTMRTFFGCLATALAYLHAQRIRHRDLKPSNILVHGTNILVTDFGFSRDCNDTRSATEGRPNGTTARYKAPEVADHAERSFSADIWSLGCVFLEMFSVLKGFRVEQLAAFMRENGTGENLYYANSDDYYANTNAIRTWLSKLRESRIEEPDSEPASWIQEMLMEDRYVRPKADELALEIATCQSASGRTGEFCGICCKSEDEEFVDVEMDDAPLFIPEPSPLFEPEMEDSKIVTSTEKTPQPSTAIGPSPREAEQNRDLTLMTPESDITQPSAPTVALTSMHRDPNQPRFFVLRSNSAMDIETSFAWSCWTCSKGTNQRLNKAFRETNAPIYLFFSIVESRRFCGVAQMTSLVDFDTTLEHWEETKGKETEWKGNFQLEWRSAVEVHYDDVKHLKMKEPYEEKNYAITRIMSGMEICFSSGIEMMRRFEVGVV